MTGTRIVRAVFLWAAFATAAALAQDQPAAPAAEAPAAEAPAAPAAEAPAAPAAEAPAAEAPAAEAPAEPAPPHDIRQVQVKVRIVETNERGLRKLGANLNYTRFVDGQEQSGSVQRISTDVFDPAGDFNRVTLPVPGFGTPLRPDEDNNNANGIQTREGGGLQATVINSDRGTMDAVFRGVEEGRDSDTVSRPELLVINGLTADINAGGEVPYQSVEYKPNAAPQLSVVFKKLGVNLNFTPSILPNNMVKLNIVKLDVTDTLRIDNIRGVDLPVFAQRSQTGVVYVPSGQTLVTGGLTSHVVRQSERRVPILGTLPVIGFPFRSRQSESNETTLLIFVTPTVVDLRNLSPEGVRAMEFWKNGTWSNEKRIDAEKDAMDY